MDKPKISPISPSRQVAFHQLLVAARKSWLMDALREALKQAPPRGRERATLHLRAH